ncbi:MAG: response regulator [Thermodesulfobacteriota bacterium]|nr:response regulator [Thermodesulfobacteriota bacterium]
MEREAPKILVVDDEVTAGKSIEKVLAKKGFYIDLAESADEGLHKIEKGLFELVLLDIMMPQVNGIELLRIIKERWPHLKVVMVTGYPSIETAVEATRLGALDYISKPFTPDELREKVEAVLLDTASEKVVPLRPVEEEASASVCPLSGQPCEIYAKKGRACKTKDGICPKIKKAQLKARKRALSPVEEIGKSAVDIDMPFDYDEVAKYTDPAYVNALSGSDMPMVNWEGPVEEAVATPYEVLVIDDEVVVGNSVRKILKSRGFRVDHAETPDAAMALLSKRPVDMILLDMKIPGVKGLDLLETIREENPTVPVIMITGYATVETAVESIKLGAIDYVPKPFTPDELHEAVERAFRRAA